MNSRIALLVAAAAIAGGALVWKYRPSASGATDQQKRGLASITVPNGFSVELAAKPGLVRYPMLGTIDDQGRIFMCESSGQTMKTPEMSADPNYIVSMLEDTDKDGVYDKSTTFADKLTLPAGAVWHKGSLYVAAPPTVYRLQDTNGDGVADVRETVVTGWNLSANAASLHGPILGPDGWLYLTDGRHGFKIDTKDGRHYEGKASRIWRLRPDGTGLEWYAGGGFDNPVEVAFTDGGDMFGTMTYFQDPRDGQRDAILHFVEGGCYPKPYPVTEEFKRTGDLMPVMTKFARIAPSGLERYRSSEFGPEFQGNLFTAQFNAHRVQRHKVFPTGASYRTEDEDFFVSSDPDLHPTDVMQDADGSLIVVDTGAWFIHGCPLSRTSKPDIHGTLYRVKRNGAHKTPVSRKDTLAKASVAELAAMHTPAAVFALYRLGTPDAVKAIREELKASNPETQQAAARQLGMLQDKEGVPALMELARKSEPHVRRQAAASLGMIGDRRAVPALVEAAANPEDRYVEHSIIYSLIQLGDAAALLAALGSKSPAVQKAALIALDQMDRSPLGEGQVMPFLETDNAELRRSALWVVSRHKTWSARLTKSLDARLRSPQFTPAEAEMVGDAMAAFCGESNMQKSIGTALGDAALSADKQLFLADVAERCSAKEFPADWKAGLARLMAHPDAKVRVRAIALVRTRGVALVDEDLRRLAADAKQPDDVRVAALSALGSRYPQLSQPDFEYLISRLDPKAEAGVKLAAGQVLARAAFTNDQLLAIAGKHMKAADPLVLPNLMDAFRNSKDEAVGLALVSGLRQVESSLGTVGSQRVQDTITRFPQGVRDAAKPLLAKLESDRNTRLDKLRKLEPVIRASGDATKGREIFFGAKAGCSSCHTVGLEGGHVGPDLTSIGAIRSPHDLLEAIVLPSESFVPGHEVYRVETAVEVYSGVLGKNTADAVILITGPNDEVRIPRKDIKSMGYAPVSLMPEGFDEVLTRAELTDLMAYMRAQTSRKASSSSD